MQTALFDYHLPKDRIAQVPVVPRDHARLLVTQKNKTALQHRKFYDVLEYLSSEDVLLLNDTRVLSCRLKGCKEETGGKAELLFIREKNAQEGLWEAMVFPGNRVREGTWISLNGFRVCVLKKTENGLREVYVPQRCDLREIFLRCGELPLPPYIRSPLKEPSQYQTIFAEHYGSCAAPTAGLHFTEELLVKIRDRGVRICFVTVHISLDTFRPIKAENIFKHPMHSEYYEVGEEVVQAVRQTKKRGGKVVAVGTTTVRALESAASGDHFEAKAGWTTLYITPGFKFKIVDALITNFHFPRSTLLVLVSAFMGYEAMKRAYQEALASYYRFLSFGDAMLIL